MNPLAYLLISLQLTSVMLALIFWLAWLGFGRKPHALMWSLAFAVAAVQWLLNLSSKSLPISFEVYWQIVNLTSILTVSLALAGHRLRVGLQNGLAWYVTGGTVVAASIAWFTFAQPHTGLRMALGPSYTALMMMLCVRAILRIPRRATATEWSLAVVTTIFAICEAAASIAILRGGAAGDPASFELYLAINFLSLPAAYTGMGLFTVLILASDMSKEMRALALTDALTGVYNVRGFHEAARPLVASARSRGDHLTALTCDIDYFKSINDRFGHAVGDAALRTYVSHLRAKLRDGDVIGRVGGEEFAVLLPSADARLACEVAERIRAAPPSLAIEGVQDRLVLRASFGVAEFDGARDDLPSLLQRADVALYQAKREGRDRVCVGSR